MIYEILAETQEHGTDIPAAMTNAMFGDGYLLSHERRLLAITLARALPELERLNSEVTDRDHRIAELQAQQAEIVNDLLAALGVPSLDVAFEVIAELHATELVATARLATKNKRIAELEAVTHSPV